ncbi:MAG: SIS domain-containing protein [Thermoplasmatota archaeon]
MDHEAYTEQVIETMRKLDLEKVRELVEMLRDARSGDSSIYIFGNGGSGAAASHFAEDVGKMTIPDYDKPQGRFRIMSLTDNTPYILCLGNDLGYDQIFSQQLMNLGREGDVAIGISGSGNSENVVLALKAARDMGMKTAALVGYDGGRIKGMVDLAVHVPSMDMQVCEDLHMHIIHHVVKALCDN